MTDTKERPVIRLDHWGQDYTRDWEAIIRERHASGCPIAWSEAHGGFWWLTGYEAVRKASETPEIFTSVNDVNKNRNGGGGVLVPQRPYQLTMNEEDPPVCLKYRIIEAPVFSPKFLPEWSELAREHLREAINAVIETGEADLIADIIQPTTARTTLKILGIPDDEWAALALPAHRSAFTPASDPNYPVAELNHVKERLGELISERRGKPGEDMLARFANARIDGEPMSQQKAVDLAIALVAGGFDTTVALATHALLWLEDQPEARQRILADSALMNNAVEEFLRVFTPAHNTARTAVQDVEYQGVRLRPGERTLLSWVAANRDPAMFDNPEEIRIDRENAREHVAFGGGVHRCLGAPLARIEVKMILTEVLTRLPDYKVQRDKVRGYPSVGLINGFITVPIIFTPARPY